MPNTEQAWQSYLGLPDIHCTILGADCFFVRKYELPVSYQACFGFSKIFHGAAHISKSASWALKKISSEPRLSSSHRVIMMNLTVTVPNAKYWLSNVASMFFQSSLVTDVR